MSNHRSIGNQYWPKGPGHTMRKSTTCSGLKWVQKTFTKGQLAFYGQNLQGNSAHFPKSPHNSVTVNKWFIIESYRLLYSDGEWKQGSWRLQHKYRHLLSEPTSEPRHVFIRHVDDGKTVATLNKINFLCWLFWRKCIPPLWMGSVLSQQLLKTLAKQCLRHQAASS